MELQFITHYTDRYTYFDSARMALEGGCRWIQLRMKDASPEEVEREALRVQDLCRQYGATFFEDVRMHYEAGADYIGCGPFRFTTTKKNLSPVLGLEGYRDIVSRMKEAGIHLPIVAIGGITFEDIPAIMQTGVSGIALSGSILRADDPIEETKRIVES